MSAVLLLQVKNGVMVALAVTSRIKLLLQHPNHDLQGCAHLHDLDAIMMASMLIASLAFAKKANGSRRHHIIVEIIYQLMLMQVNVGTIELHDYAKPAL